MKYRKINGFIILVSLLLIQCKNKTNVTDNDVISDYSGTYCLNIQNLEMTIDQTGDSLTFTIHNDLLTDGNGFILYDTLHLTAFTSDYAIFSASIVFSDDEQSFSGPFQVIDNVGNLNMEGILLGNKGTCPIYDIELNGIPRFVEVDFTQLYKIDKISKLRSGFGHSYTDGTETCRSMKHYFNPYENYRQNNLIDIYSPITGTIVSLLNDQEGSTDDLKNIEIQIQSENQPAFIFDIFHCDLVSLDIVVGKQVQAGDLLGYARMYYDTWEEYVTSFDIATWVNTPSGIRLISYFSTLTDSLFNDYTSRGVTSRDDFIITQELRDANPLECDGEEFYNQGVLDNWVILSNI